MLNSYGVRGFKMTLIIQNARQFCQRVMYVVENAHAQIDCTHELTSGISH